MLTSKKIVFYCLQIILPIIEGFILIFYGGFVSKLIFRTLFAVLGVLLSVFSIVFYKIRKPSWSRFLLFLNILLLLMLCLYAALYANNLMQAFSSISSFRDFILSTGSSGMLVYVVVQFLQVMFLPIPSMIINLAGVAIYGPLLGALLCTIGVLSASYCSFLMGKIFGYRVAVWIAGESSVIKYTNILNEKGKFFLTVAFLLPLFPDDMLCLISGITPMNFKTFAIIASITRPIGVVFMSFFGGGYIIPFSGWGLFVWPVILVVAIVAVIVVYKYQPQIEDYILSKIKRKSKKSV